jgi:hypothetical protein
VQGGLFRLDIRTAHGPAVLAFVDTGEEGRGLLAGLAAREEEFRRAEAYNYAYPNPEIRAGRAPSTRSGATVAAMVRAPGMEPVKEVQRRSKLPYYVLWDAEGRVSETYWIEGAETTVVLVEEGNRVTWVSERGKTPDPDEILKAIRPAPSAPTDPALSGARAPESG